jgi:hypothetical protein
VLRWASSPANSVMLLGLTFEIVEF